MKDRLVTIVLSVAATYGAIVAVGPQGRRSRASPATPSNGLATLEWDSVAGADSYGIVRDGKELGGPVRIEGSRKVWTDTLRP
jgi:hypothetical protein